MKIKRSSILVAIVVAFVVVITSADVKAEVSPAEITTSEQQEIEDFRAEIKRGLAGEVEAERCYNGRFFFRRRYLSIDKNLAEIELKKISEEVNKIPDIMLRKCIREDYSDAKKELNKARLIDIIIWNFDTESIEIFNLQEINNLTQRQFENYNNFCHQIASAASKKYIKDVYGMELKELSEESSLAQESAINEIEEIENPDKREILSKLFEGKDLDYYVMKQKVLDTQDSDLLEYFEKTEGRWNEYRNSEIGKISQDYFRYDLNKKIDIHKKIIQNPQYIPSLIDEWDGKQTIEDFIEKKVNN